MKKKIALALLIGACGCGLWSQAVQTTVCAVLKDPASFNGKIVTIKGTVKAGFDTFLLEDQDCGLPVNAIWVSYPQGTKGKGGPLAVLAITPAHNFAGAYTAPARAAVTLDKNKDFKQFDSILSQSHTKDPGMCLGCRKYEVTATLTGRLDGVADASLKRNDAGKIVELGGFGNLNAYPARLVLQSVADVAQKQVDYSAADAEVKGDMVQIPGAVNANDPLGMAQQYAALMQNDPGSAMVRNAVAAFGTKTENHGVVIGFANLNEAPASEAQGAQDAPDGVIYNCTLGSLDRLPQDEQSAAIIHIGQHINDLRSATANEILPLITLENNGWVVTATGVAYMRGKFLTLPGGELFLNMTWPAEQRQDKMTSALKDYLAKGMALSQ